MDPESDADISECGQYRYTLWRRWDSLEEKRRIVAFVGLNPSTADAVEDDPTIRRCVGFAKRWGFNELLMLNAYAFRATQPKAMFDAADPIGPRNDDILRGSSAEMTVAAWGTRCPESRRRQVIAALDRELYCLGVTKDGSPKHPLYLPGDADLIRIA